MERADLLQGPIPPLWLLSATIKNPLKILDPDGGHR